MNTKLETKKIKDELKEEARKLGISFSPNIGIAKLQEKINNHNNQTDLTPANVLNQNTANKQLIQDLNDEKEMNKKQELTPYEKTLKNAMKMVRCSIICNNPNKSHYQGELVIVGNSVIPPVKRFVPYNVKVAENWHLPRIIVDFLKEKTFLKAATSVENDAITQYTTQLEFTIIELPQYTPEELEVLKRKQLLHNGE